MRLHSLILTFAVFLVASISANATVFATVHGVIHDPQHRPIAGAEIALNAVGSGFTLTAKTDSNGEFELAEAPIGLYMLKVSAKGFATEEEWLTIASGTNPIVHVPLAVATATQTVVVNGAQTSLSASDTVTPTTLVTRADIDVTPGASRTIGMEMITDYVPGAYMTHDMLHMRGGHQTSWLIQRSLRMWVRRSIRKTLIRWRHSGAVMARMWATGLMECSTCCREMGLNTTAMES